MQLIYDVSHNIAKIEEHVIDGRPKTLCVHRKGSTRAFPPHHPLIPVDYQLTGQPVLIGGTMGTCSYVLTGTEQGMSETFGTTCHGAVSFTIFTFLFHIRFAIHVVQIAYQIWCNNRAGLCQERNHVVIWTFKMCWMPWHDREFQLE